MRTDEEGRMNWWINWPSYFVHNVSLWIIHSKYFAERSHFLSVAFSPFLEPLRDTRMLFGSKHGRCACLRLRHIELISTPRDKKQKKYNNVHLFKNAWLMLMLDWTTFSFESSATFNQLTVNHRHNYALMKQFWSETRRENIIHVGFLKLTVWRSIFQKVTLQCAFARFPAFGEERRCDLVTF